MGDELAACGMPHRGGDADLDPELVGTVRLALADAFDLRALGRMAAFGSGPLLICTIGLVTLSLLRTPLRFIGAVLIGCAIVLMMRAPQPDVLISADASAF